MNDPVKAALELTAAMERAVEHSVRRLAPVDDPALSIGWTQDRELMHLAVTLRSGRVIRGVGPAKLEAIVEAEERIAAGLIAARMVASPA